METAVTMEEDANFGTVNPEVQPSPDRDPPKAASSQARRRPMGRRGQKTKRRGLAEKRRGLAEKRRGLIEKRRGLVEKRRGQEKEGVTVKRSLSDGKRRWDKKHYCVFCRRPQVKIARHLLRKHADQQEVLAASALPTGSKQRHLLLEHLRCRGNYLHNIEVIRQGRGEIVPWRQPSEKFDVDARNYLPCPLCLGFFLRADLWRHQVSCRKKLAIDPSKGPGPSVETSSDEAFPSLESIGELTLDPAEKAPTEGSNQSSEHEKSQILTSEPSVNQNQNSAQNLPKRRTRVQAAASRLLPISSSASEGVSEILHRMNQDNVSYEVKSDWLICKYGNKLLENQDGNQRSYEYVSQKLRELGRLLLAAKSLDSEVQTLQDLLAPGQLSLALSAARKAAGYRWTRPPLSVRTTLKTVCDIAIGESLLDGDWEAAARTTDFYHLLGSEWDNLGLQNPDPEPAAADGGTKPKKRTGLSRINKDPRADVLSRFGSSPEVPLVPPESRLQNPVPFCPRKAQRRPWSSAEKDAIWRQLGDHVLLQTVPGKEVCQRCLDLEPVLKGRHWKDVKNQIHNQIQSQKKQQFHAQMNQEENQQIQAQNQNQKKQNPQSDQPQHNQQKQPHQSQVEQVCQNSQYQKSPQYMVPMNHQAHDSVRNQKKKLDQQNQVYPPKKQLFQTRLDQQNSCEVHKKQLYQMDHQNQQLETRDTSVLPVPPYDPDGPLRAHGHSLLDREPPIAPYPVLIRTPGPHMEPLLTRNDWTEEALVQNYQMNRPMGQNLLQHIPAGGAPSDPHSGRVHF
ncbi:uncharacterized protein LOC103129979 isoform X2 [Poecilia formosa]|uniref:uncharacterized protein LOC103129979 isoform X2 n=1 Tax=Poecilia formosa TaxID=48698 RepID=UPI00044463A4|nr:PREDICTED: uncharacterized protein LOC103129979 isoform X2 [Poecilia formosa]